MRTILLYYDGEIRNITFTFRIQLGGGVEKHKFKILYDHNKK